MTILIPGNDYSQYTHQNTGKNKAEQITPLSEEPLIQFGEFSLPPNKILPNNTALINTTGSIVINVLPQIVSLSHHFKEKGIKTNMRTYNSKKMSRLSGKQELNAGNSIQHSTRKQLQVQVPRSMVLEKQKEIVPEIVVGLLRVHFSQGTRAHMIHGRIFAIHHLIAKVSQPPAKINFFHMGEKIFIKPANFKKDL